MGNIALYGGTHAHHDTGIMYCNTGYSQSCGFASRSFSCASGGDDCDNPIFTTVSPTSNPTLAPTQYCASDDNTMLIDTSSLDNWQQSVNDYTTTSQSNMVKIVSDENHCYAINPCI